MNYNFFSDTHVISNHSDNIIADSYLGAVTHIEEHGSAITENFFS